MADLLEHPARRVTREELHSLVWERPMSRLAGELGISGTRLAKICSKLDVPYPPPGYWAKKEAGKPVVTFKLSPRKHGTPEEVDIYRTPAKSTPLPEAKESATIAAGKVEGIVVPADLVDLHPRVKAWIADHKKLQKEREQENKRHARSGWLPSELLPDLTERDLYRFRVTSAIFKGIEKASGKIEKSPITGKATFKIAGHDVECSIVEKLNRSLSPRDEIRKWTAYPDHHQLGLAPSGFLRVSITTYLDGRQPQWIESPKAKIGDMLPEIVGTIMAAGPILDQRKREQDESRKRYREEEARRYEAKRLKEIDDKRWRKFQEFSANWQERAQLLAFISEIEKRASRKSEIVADGQSLDGWIDWAKEHARMLDPFEQGLVGLFDAISKVSQWS